MKSSVKFRFYLCYSRSFIFLQFLVKRYLLVDYINQFSDVYSKLFETLFFSFKNTNFLPIEWKTDFSDYRVIKLINNVWTIIQTSIQVHLNFFHSDNLWKMNPAATRLRSYYIVFPSPNVHIKDFLILISVICLAKLTR